METGPAEILLIRPPAPAHERAAGPRARGATPEARPGPGGQPTSGPAAVKGLSCTFGIG